jgi:hypothetical protein
MKPGFVFISAIMLLMLLSCDQSSRESRAARQNRLFRENSGIVLAEIQQMLVSDQAIRSLLRYGTSDSIRTDSIERSFAQKGLDLDSLLLIQPTLLVSQSYCDAMDKQIAAQDERHTRRLIALINEYGYPESNRLDSTTNISPFLLLHHPAPQYKDTLFSLLAYELIEGRIDTISCEMIKWDLNGREGLPNIPGMKVEKNADGTTTLTL